jgi:hypothetical protein
MNDIYVLAYIWENEALQKVLLALAIVVSPK